MRVRQRVLLVLMAGFGPNVLVAQAGSGFEYFCPRSNVVLEQLKPGLSHGLVSSSFIPSSSFPESPRDTELKPNFGSFSFALEDCSTDEFYCVQVEQSYPKGKIKVFGVFLPRTIELWKEYSHLGMRAFAGEAASSPSGVRMAQVTIWQRVSERDIPLKVTIEQGRGIIYLSGLDFSSDSMSPEDCTLQSYHGLFQGIRIRPVDKRTKPLE